MKGRKGQRVNVGKKKVNNTNDALDSAHVERQDSSDEENENICTVQDNDKQHADVDSGDQQVVEVVNGSLLNSDSPQAQREIPPGDKSLREEHSIFKDLLVGPDALPGAASTVIKEGAHDTILSANDDGLDRIPSPNNVEQINNTKSQGLKFTNCDKPNDRHLLKGSAKTNNRLKLKVGKIPSHAKMDKLLCELKHEPEQKLYAGIMLKHHSNTTRGHKMDFSSKLMTDRNSSKALLDESRSNLFRKDFRTGTQGKEYNEPYVLIFHFIIFLGLKLFWFVQKGMVNEYMYLFWAPHNYFSTSKQVRKNC